MTNTARRPDDDSIRESLSRPRDSGFGETLLGDPPQPRDARRISLKPDDIKMGSRNWCSRW